MELSIISEKLEDIRNYLDVELHPVVSPDRWDVYSALCDMVDDIIALLKLREPIKPEFQRGMWICGKCGYKLARPHYRKEASYCWKCGRAVKWE